MEKRQEIIKKFSSRMQARLLLVFCVVTLIFVGLMGRLIYIVQVKGEQYAKHVLSRHSTVSKVLPYKRGEILDRNGAVLARSELQYRMNIDPMLLLQNEELLTTTLIALEETFGVENDTIHSILESKPKSRYANVLKNLRYDVVTGFEERMKEDASIIGVWFEQEYVRNYPFTTLASDILGFTSADNVGYWGIEEYYNKELNGTDGRIYGYYDASLNIERIVKEAVNGNSVVSTIDLNVQRIIQEHILAFNTEFGSKNIGVLVMDPNNGEILAMASNQEYDLNNPRSLEGFYTKEELDAMTEEEKTNALYAIWKNDVITSSFEPGSTFKPMTIASAMEENLVKESDTFYCDGVEIVNGVKIRCSKRSGHGEITLGEAIMYSCNDVLMQVAAAEGRDIFYEYQKSFAFGRKTGIDLPGEAAGITMSVEALNPIELATNSFGQAFNTTMLQMVAAYSSVVNGGYYYEPHIMKKIINENGATVREYGKVLIRQTISEETSEFLQKYLYQTVEAGTAKGAQVQGYAIGGKTGTAQKLPRDAKTYIVSFLGSVPAENPEIVIYVVIDEPQNVERQADSSIATKLASRILTEILPALGIYPEGEIDYLLPSDDLDDGSAVEGGNQQPEPGSQTGNGSGNNQDSSGSQDTQNTQSQQDNDDSQNIQDTESPAAQQNTQETQNGDDTQHSQNGSETQNSEVPDNSQDGQESQEDNSSSDEGDSGADDASDGAEDEYNPDALD